jgi:hypothetical protein
MTGPLVPVYQGMSVRETFSPGLRHEPGLKVCPSFRHESGLKVPLVPVCVSNRD